MKCIESRVRKNGLRFRRYRTDDGRTITTYEVPAAVLSAFSKKRLATQLDAWRRGEALRARRVVMLARIAEGVKPTAIAHELGISDAAVRLARKALHEPN
jgi:FixJ family two-component response regulator